MNITLNGVVLDCKGLDGIYYVTMPMTLDETVFIDVDDSDNGIVIVNNHPNAGGIVAFRQDGEQLTIPGGGSGADFRIKIEDGCASLPISLWGAFTKFLVENDNKAKVDIAVLNDGYAGLVARIEALETANKL
jgi:hypothetical protein